MFQNFIGEVAAVLVVITLSSSSVLKSPSNNDGNFELLILHNNDMHARFEQTSQLSGACTVADRNAGKCYGGFPRVAHVVKEARKAAATGEGPPVLYLNAGDTYTGTAWFTIYKWRIAAEFINALQPDAVSLGNHEFDEAVDGIVPFIKNLTAPVLAANLILDKVPELEYESNLHKSIILLKNLTKIGIIGYLTPDTKYLAPKNKVEYEDEIIALKREVIKLKNQGVKIIIALGHSGYIKDLQIAREVDDLDLVIGGHSNTFLWNNKYFAEKPEFPQGAYPTIVEQSSGRKVPVVQAYAYTKYMGRLHVIFDSKGEIINYDGEPLLLNQEIPRDPELLKTIEKYREDVDRINSEVVGSSLVFLNGEDCRVRECNIGNIITDAMLNYTRHFHNLYSDVNIAIIQGGRIRASIDRPEKPYEMTREDWVTVLPFTDPLNIVNMNGSVLLKSLEHAVESWRTIDSPGQFLQFSGMEVIYDLSKLPGSRVKEAKVLCSKCEKQHLIRVHVVDNQQYKVIMPEFLADSGDGFTMFANLSKETLPYYEGVCVLDYISKLSPVNPKVSGRITILNEDKVEAIPGFVSPKNQVRKDRFLPSSNAIKVNININLFIFCIFLIQFLYFNICNGRIYNL